MRRRRPERCWTGSYRVEPIDHVIGFAVAENLASRRVLEKAGMVFTGIQALHGIPNAFYRHDRRA
jgi:ribosomal-protein-alanine N-acetyltransferase